MHEMISSHAREARVPLMLALPKLAACQLAHHKHFPKQHISLGRTEMHTFLDARSVLPVLHIVQDTEHEGASIRSPTETEMWAIWEAKAVTGCPEVLDDGRSGYKNSSQA